MMALSPDLGAAGNVLVFIVCTCNWFNGIIVPYHQIQTFWRYWVRDSSLPLLPILSAHENPSSTTYPPSRTFSVAWSQLSSLPSTSHAQSRT